jgi:hypothetical protein
MGLPIKCHVFLISYCKWNFGHLYWFTVCNILEVYHTKEFLDNFNGNWISVWNKIYSFDNVTNLKYLERTVTYRNSLDPRFEGSNPAEDDGFLRVIKITTSFGGEEKPSVPCRRFTACKRTLRAWNRCFVGKIQRPCFSCFATRWLWQTNQDWVEIMRRQKACYLHRRYTVWDTEKASLNKLQANISKLRLHARRN